MPHTLSAFTLIEVLASLAIISILLAIGLPFARDFSSHMQDQILQNELVHAVELTRHAAISHHTSAILCASQNQKTCDNHWAAGQLIYENDNDTDALESAEQILFVQQNKVRHGAVYLRMYPQKKALAFSPNGLLQSDNATFWHCHHNVPVWAISISKVGEVNLVKPD